MVRAGTGVSCAATAQAAAEDALAQAREGLGSDPASAAMLVVTPPFAAALPDAAACIAAALGPAALAGASVDGLLAPGLEPERRGALGLWLLSGVEAHAALVDELPADSGAIAQEIVHTLGTAPQAGDLLVALADPAASPALARGLAAAAAGACVVGSAAAEAADGCARLLAHGDVARGGLALLLLRGAAPVRMGVTSGCRLVAGPFTVTKAAGHWVHALDGRPALDVYREAAREPLARDLRHAFAFLLAVVPTDSGPGAGGEALVVRALAGASEQRRAFALPEPVTRGQRLGFALRDAAGGRAGMRDLLDRAARPRPTTGLYLTCRERGESLFGMPGIEAAYLEHALGGLPLLGLRGSWQIGPAGTGGGPVLLTHTGVLALL